LARFSRSDPALREPHEPCAAPPENDASGDAKGEIADATVRLRKIARTMIVPVCALFAAFLTVAVHLCCGEVSGTLDNPIMVRNCFYCFS
jgi:hypothetical protein